MEEKENKKKYVWVKICPNCGSLDVTDRGMISEKAYSNVNVCKSCGFQSPLFPEIKVSLEELEELKKIGHKPPKFVPSQLPIFPYQDYQKIQRKNKVLKIITILFIAMFVTLWICLAFNTDFILFYAVSFLFIMTIIIDTLKDIYLFFKNKRKITGR